jgi:hypothetical protein
VGHRLHPDQKARPLVILYQQAPNAWARRPAGFLACYGPSFLTDPGKPSGPRIPTPVRARSADDTGNAPRGAPMSAIDPAPAAIPATRQATFRSGCTPALAVIWTWRRTRPHSPARSASDMTGTSPARDARFGSSKHADDLQRVVQQSHPASALLNWPTGTSATPIVPVQRALSALARRRAGITYAVVPG